MTLDRKQTIIMALAGFFLVALLIVAWVEGGRARVVAAPKAVVTSENRDCVDCHKCVHEVAEAELAGGQ